VTRNSAHWRTFMLALLTFGSCYHSVRTTGYHHLLSQVSFPPALLLLNQWYTPPLVQVSDCSIYRITCDVPSTAVFFVKLLTELLQSFMYCLVYTPLIKIIL